MRVTNCSAVICLKYSSLYFGKWQYPGGYGSPLSSVGRSRRNQRYNSSLIIEPFTGQTLIPHLTCLPCGPTSIGEGWLIGAAARESPLITTARAPPYFRVQAYTSGVAYPESIANLTIGSAAPDSVG